MLDDDDPDCGSLSTASDVLQIYSLRILITNYFLVIIVLLQKRHSRLLVALLIIELFILANT